MVQNQEEAEEPSYFFTCEWVDYSPEHLTSEGFYDENRYGMGILQIEIPDDNERENRINQMLVEEGMERLPSGREKEWWKMVKMHVDYRSNSIYVGIIFHVHHFRRIMSGRICISL